MTCLASLVWYGSSSSRKTNDKAIKLARSGKGPSFIEMKTCRYRSLYVRCSTLRTKEEVEEYRKIDPITQVKEGILSKKYTKKELEIIDASVKERVKNVKILQRILHNDPNLMYNAVYEQNDYPFIKHKL